MNAVIHDAVPVIFDPDKQEVFKSDLENVLAGNNISYTLDKEEILNKDTNIDRMIWIFKTVGLSKVASDLKSLKVKLLKEYK